MTSIDVLEEHGTRKLTHFQMSLKKRQILSVTLEGVTPNLGLIDTTVLIYFGCRWSYSVAKSRPSRRNPGMNTQSSTSWPSYG